MTQPTDRPGIDHLTSDQLDQLYTRLDDAEAKRDAWHDWADTLAYKVAPVEVLGRHGEEGRQPWSDALDMLTPAAEVDQLRERAEKAEREADEAVAAAAHLARLVGKRSEKAERNAEKQRRRADVAETELHTLRCGLRANGADPTQIQNLWAQIHLRNRQWREEKQRADQAEATLTAVRDWANALADPKHLGQHGIPHRLIADHLRAVLDQHGQTPA